MNTTLSTKLVALMLALSVNTVIMGGVALMFSSARARHAFADRRRHLSRYRPYRCLKPGRSAISGLVD